MPGARGLRDQLRRKLAMGEPLKTPERLASGQKNITVVAATTVFLWLQPPFGRDPVVPDKSRFIPVYPLFIHRLIR